MRRKLFGRYLLSAIAVLSLFANNETASQEEDKAQNDRQAPKTDLLDILPSSGEEAPSVTKNADTLMLPDDITQGNFLASGQASVTQPAATTTAPAGGKGKGKKTKGQKLDIDDFVDSSNFKMVDSSWADIMEDEDVIAPSSYHVSLPSAPKSVQGPDIDFNAIPPNGPFRAHVANLQYEVNEEQLADMFKGLSVAHLRLNTEGGRAIGTASVEFNSKNDLIEALNMNNRQLNGRSVRIFLPNQDRYGDRDRRGGGGSRGSYIDNTPMNWRSADRTAPRGGDGEIDPRVPPKTVFPPPTVGYGMGGSDRGYGSRGSRSGFGDGDGYRPPRNDYGGYGGRRDYDRAPRDDDGGFGRRDGGRRDRYGDEGRGNWGRGPRGGADSAEPEADNWRTSRGDAPPPAGDRDFGRRDNGPRSYGRDRDPDSMPPAGRDGPPPSFGRGSGEYRRRDEEGGYGGRDYDRAAPRAPADDLYEPAAPGARRTSADDYEPPRSFAPPRERTTSGRSIPEADLPAGVVKPNIEEPRRSRPPELRPERLANLLGGGAEELTEKPASYSSIFGGAKPVDTMKREMEIERKLAEEKAAAAEKEAAAKEAAAAAAAAAAGVTPDGTSPSGSQVGESTRPPRGDRLPRGEGAPPPRMRKENGEGGPPRDEHRRHRDGDRRRGGGYDDRNGGYDRRRMDGERRPRMGEGGAGSRPMGGGRRDGRSGDAYGNFGGDRSHRGYGDRREGGGHRFREDGGQPDRYFSRGGGGGGSGGRDFDRPDYRERFVSDSDDITKEGVTKSYVTSNKYDYLNDAEAIEHTSD